MNAIAKRAELAIPAFAMDEQELIEVLRNSLYPGAQDGSIKMIIGYCRASGLDPMQKPAHIVPIWDAKAKEMRDVVMPGIGLYRTQAARSGNYAGVTEPEFGPDVTETLGGVTVTYPAWCKVIVKRSMANGTIVEFAAVERWKENYATAKRDTDAPNAMWRRRPYGQLAKCAEAQALRKAFPEFGSAPTAEEMEGKEIYAERDITPAKQEPAVIQYYPEDKFNEQLPSWVRMISENKTTPERIIAKVELKAPLTEAQRKKLMEINLESEEVVDQ